MQLTKEIIDHRKEVDAIRRSEEAVTRVNNKLVCGLFDAPDVSYISKPALVKKLAKFKRDFDYLTVELFIANPDHPFFRGTPELSLAPLRVERVRRKG